MNRCLAHCLIIYLRFSVRTSLIQQFVAVLITECFVFKKTNLMNPLYEETKEQEFHLN